MSRHLLLRLLLLTLVTSVVAAPAAWSSSAEQSATCHTIAQNITERKSISCRQARKVATRAWRAVDEFPECPEDGVRWWNGWRLTPDPVGNIGIGTRFKKRDRSFYLTGGGAC